MYLHGGGRGILFRRLRRSTGRLERHVGWSRFLGNALRERLSGRVLEGLQLSGLDKCECPAGLEMQIL